MEYFSYTFVSFEYLLYHKYFMAADAAEAQLNLNKLLSDRVCKLNTDVDVLRKEIEELKQTMSGGDNSDS